MRAITLHQPWASLVALRVKTIETRSWKPSASAIGQPLAIHAGKRRPFIIGLGSWFVSDDELFDAKQALVRDSSEPPIGHPMPLGAIVATARLVDVVPIVFLGEEQAVRRIEVGTWGGDPNLMLCLPHPEDEFGLDFDASDFYERDVSDQLPYGDFTPNRFAWLLEDIAPTTEPIACRGKQGLWTLPADVEAWL